jgi:hypothetical protein
MIIVVEEMCPFEHAEFPYCKLVHRDKNSWCNPNGKIHKRLFAPPPKWCPLRKSDITVKLKGCAK